MSLLKSLQNRIQGWLPKAPSLCDGQESKTVMKGQKTATESDAQRKIFKRSTVANAVIVNLFLLAHLLIDPHNKNMEYAAGSWSVFLVSLSSVNFLLYRYPKRNQNTTDPRLLP
ncbi:MAG: hypothetical protein ACBZ72_13310 [Candidatus Bathyarchaeia archaeon]|jgi:hypothetical protein